MAKRIAEAVAAARAAAEAEAVAAAEAAAALEARAERVEGNMQQQADSEVRLVLAPLFPAVPGNAVRAVLVLQRCRLAFIVTVTMQASG